MAISDPPFTIPVADGGPDDLPRTIRRERDARQRQARERMLSEAAGPAAYHHLTSDPTPATGGASTVARLEIPFLHLVAFFLKAVFAAVPALVVLASMVWGAAHLLQSWFPDLVKMQILILFPPG